MLRLLSLFLALSLISPSPALALRVQGVDGEETRVLLQAGMEGSGRSTGWFSAVTAVLLGIALPAVLPDASNTALAQKAKAPENLSLPLDIKGMKGELVKVTSLEDSGEGSFRAAAERKGPRIVVFETSGEIKLKKPIDIKYGNVVIAGQTAPAPGVTIRGAGLIIRGPNVRVEGLRIRVGDEKEGDPKSDRDAIQVWGPMDPKAPKGVEGANNVLIRNVSLSWWTDDIGVWFGVKGVTFERVIFAEALHNSIHSRKKPHSKGLLIGPGSEVLVKDSVLTSLMDRNPFVKNGAKAVFVNNVVHNWGSSKYATHIGADDRAPWYTEPFPNPSFVTVEGNVYIRGPNTQPAAFGPAAVGVWHPGKKPAADPKDPKNHGAHPGTQVFVNDNLVLGGGIQPLVVRVPFDPIVKTRPVWVEGLKVRPAKETEAFVLANAGAFPRDAVDDRIIKGVKDRTGTKVIDSQREVGGWLKIPVNKAPFDAPAKPNEDSGDGTTNLEKLLRKLSEDALKGAGKKTSSLNGVLFNGYTFVTPQGFPATIFDVRLSPGLLEKLEPGLDRIVLKLDAPAADLHGRRVFTQFKELASLLPKDVGVRQLSSDSEYPGQIEYELRTLDIESGDVLIVESGLDPDYIRTLLGRDVRPVVVRLDSQAAAQLTTGQEIASLVLAAERQPGRMVTMMGGVEEFGGQRAAVLIAT